MDQSVVRKARQASIESGIHPSGLDIFSTLAQNVNWNNFADQ